MSMNCSDAGTGGHRAAVVPRLKAKHSSRGAAADEPQPRYYGTVEHPETQRSAATFAQGRQCVLRVHACAAIGSAGTTARTPPTLIGPRMTLIGPRGCRLGPPEAVRRPRRHNCQRTPPLTGRGPGPAPPPAPRPHPQQQGRA